MSGDYDSGNRHCTQSRVSFTHGKSVKHIMESVIANNTKLGISEILWMLVYKSTPKKLTLQNKTEVCQVYWIYTD